MAFRALVLILVVASFFAAGGERFKRSCRGFRLAWRGCAGKFPHRRVGHAAGIHRAAARHASGLRPGDTAQAGAPVSVPAAANWWSARPARSSFDIVRQGGLEDAPAEARAPLPAGTEEHRFVIKGDGSAAVHGVLGNDLVWTFTAIPDRAPTIELTKDPERQARGALRLDYKMDDDYGVVEAKATFALKDEATVRQATPSIVHAPEYALTLPQARTRSGAAQTTHDLTEHRLGRRGRCHDSDGARRGGQ